MDFRDLLLMQLCSWLLHPGYQREGTKVPSLEDIFAMVDAVCEEREKRWQS